MNAACIAVVRESHHSLVLAVALTAVERVGARVIVAECEPDYERSARRLVVLGCPSAVAREVLHPLGFVKDDGDQLAYRICPRALNNDTGCNDCMPF